MATNVSKNAAAGIRTFLGIELPGNIRARLAEVTQALEAHRGALKLVSSEAFHVTVRFLGTVSPALLPRVEAAAQGSAVTCSAFSLRLSGLGAFPGGRRAARVIWIGLVQDGGYETFRGLYDSTEKALEPLGFSREERAFSPHVTLARLREGTTVAAGKEVAETVARLGRTLDLDVSFPVAHMTLFRSDLGPSGPRYTPLARLALQGTA